MSDDEIRAVMRDPCTSYTLRDQLEIALDRDPVDALSDAELLVRLLKARLESDPDFVKGDVKSTPLPELDAFFQGER